MAYRIEEVQGDGHWEQVATARTERAAARRAHELYEPTGLRHTVTGLAIGAVRVRCPDGNILVGTDLDIARLC